MTLAESYGLDSNLVYKRRWQQSNFLMTAIQDFLVVKLNHKSKHKSLLVSVSFLTPYVFQSKITDRFWVLEECIERVPIEIDAVKELLQYGLLGTNKAVFQAIIDNIEFENSFIVTGNDDDQNDFQKLYKSTQQPIDENSDKESEKELKAIKLPDFSRYFNHL